MAKKSQKPDFAQVAHSIVERATGSHLTEKPLLALASAPKLKAKRTTKSKRQTGKHK